MGKNMVPVYGEEYDEADGSPTRDILAEVEYNDKLDYWDGRNYTCGSTGLHKGLAQLEDGRFVLIHGTQWQGKQDSAEIITPDQACREILRSGNTDLFDEYPELQEIGDSMPREAGGDRSKTFAVRVNKHASPDEIAEKIAEMGKKIRKFCT